MAIQHLTYLDLTPEQRREGAKRARDQLRSLLQNPMLTPEQLTALSDRMVHIDNWEKGALEIPKGSPQKGLPSPVREPQHHEVSLTEGVPVKAKLS